MDQDTQKTKSNYTLSSLHEAQLYLFSLPTVISYLHAMVSQTLQRLPQSDYIFTCLLLSWAFSKYISDQLDQLVQMIK